MRPQSAAAYFSTEQQDRHGGTCIKLYIAALLGHLRSQRRRFSATILQEAEDTSKVTQHSVKSLPKILPWWAYKSSERVHCISDVRACANCEVKQASDSTTVLNGIMQAHHQLHRNVDFHLTVKHETYVFACSISVAHLQCTMPVPSLAKTFLANDHAKSEDHVTLQHHLNPSH
jgi:hypothetical protein